jgi:hypothetical protein
MQSTARSPTWPTSSPPSFPNPADRLVLAFSGPDVVQFYALA